MSGSTGSQATRILDLACGTGIVIRTLALRVPANAAFTGLDISPGMLAKAEALTEDLEVPLEWQQGCAACIPFPDDAFELILCQQGLQFFPNHYAGLKVAALESIGLEIHATDPFAAELSVIRKRGMDWTVESESEYASWAALAVSGTGFGPAAPD